MSSPSKALASESTKINLSPSPSRATPKSASLSRTAFFKTFKSVDPQFSLMFKPFGSSDIATTSAPNSLKTFGATSYAAPFAVSITILIFFRLRSLEKVFLQYSI